MSINGIKKWWKIERTNAQGTSTIDKPESATNFVRKIDFFIILSWKTHVSTAAVKTEDALYSWIIWANVKSPFYIFVNMFT